MKIAALPDCINGSPGMTKWLQHCANGLSPRMNGTNSGRTGTLADERYIQQTQGTPPEPAASRRRAIEHRASGERKQRIATTEWSMNTNTRNQQPQLLTRSFRCTTTDKCRNGFDAHYHRKSIILKFRICDFHPDLCGDKRWNCRLSVRGPSMRKPDADMCRAAVQRRVTASHLLFIAASWQGCHSTPII